MQKKQKELLEQNDSLEKQLVVSKGKLGEVLNELAEAESKCVSLQEQQKKIKGNIVDGGKNILGKITQKISGKK